MKRFKSAFVLMICFFLAIPAVAGAVTIQELVANAVPSPITVISSKYAQEAGYIMVDWKIANIPSESTTADIYIYLREKTSDRTTSTVSLLELLGLAEEDTTTETTEGTIYYVTFNFLNFLTSGDFMSSMAVTTEQTAFLSGFDMAQIADENGDFIMDSFPVDVSGVPDIGEGGRFLMYLALVEPDTGEVINYALDLLKVVGADFDDEDYDDEDYDDEDVDIIAECDTDGDGVISDEEADDCEYEVLPMECDTDGDGVITEEEADACYEDMYQEPPAECDTDGDGIVTPEEMDACDYDYEDEDEDEDEV